MVYVDPTYEWWDPQILCESVLTIVVTSLYNYLCKFPLNIVTAPQSICFQFSVDPHFSLFYHNQPSHPIHLFSEKRPPIFTFLSLKNKRTPTQSQKVQPNAMEFDDL